MPVQIPDPTLAKDLGVTSYLLLVTVLAGISTSLWVARRLVMAMDRIADSLTPLGGRVDALGVRLDSIEEKVDRSVELGEEHVRIARMWERTEAPGRAVRKDPPRPGQS